MMQNKSKIIRTRKGLTTIKSTNIPENAKRVLKRYDKTVQHYELKEGINFLKSDKTVTKTPLLKTLKPVI